MNEWIGLITTTIAAVSAGLGAIMMTRSRISQLKDDMMASLEKEVKERKKAEELLRSERDMADRKLRLLISYLARKGLLDEEIQNILEMS